MSSIRKKKKTFLVFLVLLSNTDGWKILGETALFQKSDLLKMKLTNFDWIKF